MSIDKSYSNEFEKQLEVAGYKWFKDMLNNSLRGFQKRFTDEKGTKYFITGYHYNFGKIYPYVEDRDEYSFDVQFRFREKDYVVDLRFSGTFLPNKWDRPISTLKDVEEFYEKAWRDMGADYYELKEDALQFLSDQAQELNMGYKKEGE